MLREQNNGEKKEETNVDRHSKNIAKFTGWRRTNGRQRVFFRDGKPAHEPGEGSSKRGGTHRGHRGGR